MTTSVLQEPVVRRYLRELDLAAVRLPRPQAVELIAQIRSHLEDSLSPNSTAAEAAEVLERLGKPSDLVAEEALDPRASTPAKRLGRRLRIVRKRTWVVLVAALAVVVPISTVWLSMLTAPGLQGGGLSGWWFPADGEASTSVDTFVGPPVTEAPLRSGQEQGIVISIYNPSSFTQTVLGLDPSEEGGLGSHLNLGIAAPPGYNESGDFHALHFSLPVSVLPHHFAALRLLFDSTECIGSGVTIEFSSLRVEVHTGWMDRTETINFPGGFALKNEVGTSATDNIGDCS